MNLKILSILALEISMLSLISAETTIPGGTVSGTWTKANSPYHITGNISIPADDTLIIEPGVEVEFSGNYSFTINGLLEALGSENDSIYFTATTEWMGLSFNNAPDSSRLAYCIIERSFYGGIVCTNSNPVISQCTLNDNGGEVLGYGGIGVINSNPSISFCNIRNNKASLYSGGGINLQNSSPKIFNCSIIDNYSMNNGGGISCGSGGTPLISHCFISGNEANNSGGGIGVLDGGNPLIRNCTISENTADFEGGGIYFQYGSNGTVQSCILTSNTSYTQGGGIYISSSGGIFEINNSTIKNCQTKTASSKGGGIYIGQADSVIIMSTTIDANSSGGEGGTAYSVDCNNLILNHCDVVNNAGQLCEGGIFLNGNTNIIVKNSIFRDQVGPDIWFQSYSSASVSYNDFLTAGNFYKPPAGLGTPTQINVNGDSCDVFYNIFLDPLFENPAAGNYHLMWSNFPVSDQTKSPCIDAGDPDSERDPDSTFTDIGRYFFDQRVPQIALSDSALDFGPVLLGWQADTELTVYNNGSDTLVIHKMFNNQSAFTTNYSPSDSLILPADSISIIITFLPGEPSALCDTLFIENNDRICMVKLTGLGLGIPQILLSDSIFDFGKVTTGQPSDSTLSIYNNGSDTLVIHKIFNNQSVFTTNYNPSDSLIQPGDSISILITFTPVDTLSIVDTLQIHNNDQDCIVKLIGTGQLPPIIPIDCNGDTNGLAFIDSCGICAGGNTGIIPVLDKESCTNQLGDILNPSFNNILNPNPVQNILHINLQGTRAILRISDISGKCLLQKQIIENESTIDISGLKNGIYFVNVLYDNQIFTGRIIKY